MKHLIKSAVLMTLALMAATGCKKERGVEVILITTPREGQTVQDDFIELQEGQAVGVRVIGKKEDKLKPGWEVTARSEELSVVRVQASADEEDDDPGNLFVVSGLAPGQGRIRFKLKGKYDVFVEAMVTERPEWESTVEPMSFGGASGE